MTSGILRLVVWYKFSDVSEVFAASIIRAMNKLHVSNSEMLVNFYQATWWNNREDSFLDWL
jgi:hypothetical protein